MGGRHGQYHGVICPATPSSRELCAPAPFSGASAAPATPRQGVPPWTRYAMSVGFVKEGISAYCLRKRNWYFHGHHKTKATAGNRASTFRQQPFVFPSAPHPVGGINAALPVGVYPTCAVKELFPTCSEICLLFGIHAHLPGLYSSEATSQHE